MLSMMNVIMSDWIFGYGSLIWNPEVDYDHAELGRLHGFHRAFCIRSTRYRGTPEKPGVVLGLDRGGSCVGLAFRLHLHDRRQAIERLYEREMGGDNVYVPSRMPVTLASGQRVQALTFVANRTSDSYQRLPDGELLTRLAGCCGQRGHNLDYLVNTLHSLEQRGVRDSMLKSLVRRVNHLRTSAAQATLHTLEKNLAPASV